MAPPGLGLYRALLLAPRALSTRPLSTLPALHSPLAPTFSSRGDPRALVTRLGPLALMNVIVRGKPNSALPNVSCEDFLPEAVEAVGLTTRAASEGDWDSLEGLVELRCIYSLREQLEGMGEVERGYVALEPKDVFLSFISNPEKCAHGRDFTLVTFSLPGLQDARSSDLIEAIVKFASNEMVIGNYRIVKSSQCSQWVVSEIGQVNMTQAFMSFVRFEWKLRLWFSCRAGTSYLSVMRVDWVANIMLALLLAIWYLMYGTLFPYTR